MLFPLQMLMLVTSLTNDDSKPLQNNYRLAQDLHGRRVLASFQTTLLSTMHLPAGKACVSVLGLHLGAGLGQGAGITSLTEMQHLHGIDLPGR